MRIAIVLRGGVSKISGRQLGVIDSHADDVGSFINIEPCATSFKKHILEANKNIELDVFIHTWNLPLVNLLKDLYLPVKILAEDNNNYQFEIDIRVKKSMENRINKNFGSRFKYLLKFFQGGESDLGGDLAGISQALSIKKGIELALNFENQSRKYDAIFLYRPDLLLLKNIDLTSYSMSQITCNNMGFNEGDFHFFVPRNFAKQFSELFDSPFLGNYHKVHHWIREYVVKFMNVPYGQDCIKAGLDQEVLRKVKASLISFDEAKKYGLKQSDWDSFDG